MLTTEPVELTDCKLLPSGVVKFLSIVGEKWQIDLNPPHAENTRERIRHLVSLYSYLSGIFQSNDDPAEIQRRWLDQTPPDLEGKSLRDMLTDGTEKSALTVLYAFEDQFLRP
jgi:hypothetical protein